MRVFVDTEFTSFSDPRLISVGLVAEDRREIYRELTDGWTVANCTSFVCDVVLPLLHHDQGVAVTRSQCARDICIWLESLGQPVTLIANAEEDLYLLGELIKLGGEGAPMIEWELLGSSHKELLFQIQQALINSGVGNARHNALADARSLRACYLKLCQSG